MESYEYDVFISFASGDVDVVRPLWQDLTVSGLRVFWSDAVLRNRIGASWFDVIQDSLDRSRHFLLVCTPASLASMWVKREYVAFFNHCYRPPARVLVPVLALGARVDQLPLFLRGLEACVLTDPDVRERLIRVFGGVDITALQAQLVQREEELLLLRQRQEFLSEQIREHEEQRSRARDTELAVERLSAELTTLRSERETMVNRINAQAFQLDDQRELRAELTRRFDEAEGLRRERDALQKRLEGLSEPAMPLSPLAQRAEQKRHRPFRRKQPVARWVTASVVSGVIIGLIVVMLLKLF